MAQKTVRSVFMVNAANVPVENLEKAGAEGVKVRYLVDERQGSMRFALRLYTVEKGGHTPLDQHEYEHQVYVLRGRGFLKQSDDNTSPPKKLSQGDAIFVPSNAVHQFINQDDEPLVFLCVKGNPALYASSPNTPAKRPELNFC